MRRKQGQDRRKKVSSSTKSKKAQPTDTTTTPWFDWQAVDIAQKSTQTQKPPRDFLGRGRPILWGDQYQKHMGGSIQLRK